MSIEQNSNLTKFIFSTGYMMVCYFTNWAMYRPGIGKYTPENINPDLCTHIVYGFATLDYSTHKMKIFDRWADIDSPSKEQLTGA